MRRFTIASGLLIALGTASISCAGAAQDPTLEELAELFARYPEGTGFQLSPNGDRFVANMPRDGSMGAMVFDVSDPKEGLSKGTYFAPTSKYEISSPMWIDNDNVGYNLVAFDSYLTGYAIDQVKPGERTSLTYTASPGTGNYGPDFFRYLVNGLPSEPGLFMVQESHFKGDRYYFPNILIKGLTRYQNTYLLERWVNPGWFESWIFRGLDPYAVVIDENLYTMDFDLLTKNYVPSRESVQETLVPLDLPGKLQTFIGDIAVLSVPSEDGDKEGLLLYNVDDRKNLTKPFFADGYSLADGSGYIMTYRSGGEIAGILYHTDKPQAHYFDPGLAGIMKQLESMIPDGIPVFEGLSADNRFLYYEIRSDTKDSTYMRLDLQTRSSEWLYGVRPWIVELDLTPMQPISFKNREDQTIHGYLILPGDYESGESVPLVALSHGGPWVRDHWGFDEEAQFYASLGYAVLKVNYRGSTGYGKAYALDGNLIAISEAAPEDVIDGVKWAISEGYAEPDRIAFVGGSYGAYLSLFCAALEPELPACAIGFAGVYDWELAYDADSEEEKPFVEEMYKDFDTKQDRYRDLSPTNHAEKIKAPILLVHGGKDARVGYRQANAMAKALDKAGGNYELVKRRFLLHGYPNEKYKAEHFQMVGEFLQRHLD